MGLSLDKYLAKYPLSEFEKQLMVAEEARLDRLHQGYELRRCREQSGLTQAPLAVHLGVPRSTIAKIEKGEHENSLFSSTIQAYLHAHYA